MLKRFAMLSAMALASCGDGSSSPPPPETSEFVHGTSSTGMPTATKTTEFEACLANIRGMAGELAVAPVNVVESNDLRIVRFVTSDGSVLVTCSRPDRKMIVVQSPHQG